MLIVGSDPHEVERSLLAGELACPACREALRPWGHARWRTSRAADGTVRHRPRRGSCSGCGKTQVLLAASWLARRADAASVIGTALLAGPVVRFTVLLGALDPQAAPLLPRGTVFADAVEAVGRAASAAVLRLSPCSPWEFASKATGGLLLAPPGLAAGRPVVGNTN